ncbi:MAG: transketolase [Candidatus Omnitrophica bacterium]|nr:transketolase [Candidatus Omnitrophota bacterium]
MKKRPDIKELKKKAIAIRKDILTMLERAGSGHTGGSLSEVEILVALYYYKLKFDAKNPEWERRDRFVLSKGHGCPALYAVLADVGFFPKKELMTLRQLGSRLQGHPQLGLPGLEISSGSLGQGLSIANGMALGLRLNNNGCRVYCLIGDGETNEGQIWEGAMTASHYNLDNICVIMDRNHFQIDGLCCDVKEMAQLKSRWEAFGWHSIEVDGHDVERLMEALDEAEKIKRRPAIIIADTVKGKGISFIEHNNKFHGVAPKKEELKQALRELDKQLKKL